MPVSMSARGVDKGAGAGEKKDSGVVRTTVRRATEPDSDIAFKGPILSHSASNPAASDSAAKPLGGKTFKLKFVVVSVVWYMC